MCLKSHMTLGREKNEGVKVQACRDMTLHFFPPETSINILALIRCPAWRLNPKKTIRLMIFDFTELLQNF